MELVKPAQKQRIQDSLVFGVALLREMKYFRFIWFCTNISLVFDLIPIIINILIFILITNQPAHNSQVDQPTFVA